MVITGKSKADRMRPIERGEVIVLLALFGGVEESSLMEGPRKRAASWRGRGREQPHGGGEEESSLMEGWRKRAASWRGRGREQPHGGVEEQSSLMEETGVGTGGVGEG